MASSGDLLADRRYGYAEAALAEGDWEAAADLARQTVEIAPGFAPAWFLLGSAAERLAVLGEAVAAYRRALAIDPADALGATLRLALLGAGEPAMPPAYVRQLFDDYADAFDRHLRRSLAYRGPEVVADALRRACSRRLRPMRFGTALDLGCGTGLAGEVLRPVCATLAGVDLSPAMVRKAAARRIYDELAADDLSDWLATRPRGAADLAVAVDVFVYLGDLAPVFRAVAEALAPGGLLAFTVQAGEGETLTLGEDHRFWHAEPQVRGWAEAAGFGVVLSEPASTRRDRGADVPGRVLVLERPA